MDKISLLQHYFGYGEFRPGQEELVDGILNGRDVFGIMPTGGGKSICYQLPGLMLPGVTLVISPLISLMHDQVMALKAAGIPGAYVNSSLTFPQLRAVYRNMLMGRYKIIYVAPERLESEGFLDAVMQMNISMVAVDEAHCISQWGQDFRPSYLRIVEFIRRLPRRPVIAAFTATATEKVRQDVKRILELRSPVEVVTGFDRPNLYFEVLHPELKEAELLKLLEKRKGKSGIVYCATRLKGTQFAGGIVKCSLLHGYRYLHADCLLRRDAAVIKIFLSILQGHFSKSSSYSIRFGFDAITFDADFVELTAILDGNLLHDDFSDDCFHFVFSF